MYEDFDPYDSCGGMITVCNDKDGGIKKQAFEALKRGVKKTVPYDFNEFIVFDEEFIKSINQLRVTWRYYPGTDYQIKGILAVAKMRAEKHKYWGDTYKFRRSML